MKLPPIVIAGPIGTFMYEGKEIKGMELLDLVAQVNARIDESTKELEFEFSSPGGRDETGISMYNYLMSLKTKGIKLIGYQAGIIGSTATRPWLAMDERIALDDGTKNFFIHNPWLPHGIAGGDANEMQRVTDVLRAKETASRNFYVEHTGVTEEGLKPLMDDQTGFDADTAIALKFATSKTKSYNLAAYIMKKEESKKALSLLEQLIAAFKTEKKDEVLSMIIELEGGQKVSAPVEDPSKLVKDTPIMTVDAEGKETQVPVNDGDYVTKDGIKFTVTAGKLAADAVAKTEAEPPESSESDSAITAALAELLKVVKAQTPVTEVRMKELIQEEITAFKKTVKTTFTPPAASSENHAADVLEWERSFKANEHGTMRKENPEKYIRLYYAKYGKVPNI